ncbi:hypothetical protein L484_017761 [Morus notabilis]|uniref:Uncharacterized protein n=1 Tax=Morus notabilis TaxID=981085 RepID=W9RRN6_9ROSA|nr:hypothetical protein L484_017761 [Morus notabilis]
MTVNTLNLNTSKDISLFRRRNHPYLKENFCFVAAALSSPNLRCTALWGCLAEDTRDDGGSIGDIDEDGGEFKGAAVMGGRR